MSHEWVITWKGFGGALGGDTVFAPTLQEALYIWTIDQNAPLKNNSSADT